MIICDSGPIVSALNRAEGRRHEFAAQLLAAFGRRVVVPWPVYTEVDLLMRSRGHAAAADAFGTALVTEVHRLEPPTSEEHADALRLGRRYPNIDVDLPDLTVMAMAHARKADVLTWDFRHFRTVVRGRGHTWPLVVTEADLPSR